jgi:hypothetical protein
LSFFSTRDILFLGHITQYTTFLSITVCLSRYSESQPLALLQGRWKVCWLDVAYACFLNIGAASVQPVCYRIKLHPSLTSCLFTSFRTSSGHISGIQVLFKKFKSYGICRRSDFYIRTDVSEKRTASVLVVQED